MDSIGTGVLPDESYDWALQFSFASGAVTQLPSSNKMDAETRFNYFAKNPIGNQVSVAVVRKPKHWQVMKVVDTSR